MITAETRALLCAFSLLTLLAFVVLFVRAEASHEIFAWTIKPAATAAFLGAAYAAGCVLVVRSLVRGSWAVARIPFLTVLIFTLVTLAATALHLDKLHFTRELGVARFAAWFWAVIYVVVPTVMIILLVRGPAQPTRRDPQPSVPIPRPVAAVLALQGVVFGVVGVALFIRPTSAVVLWPWPLTDLTARVIAAWLIAFAVGAVLALRAGDLARLDVSASAYAVLAVLELVVLARFADVIRWDAAATWMYIAVAVSILASAAYALVRLRRTRPAVGH